MLWNRSQWSSMQKCLPWFDGSPCSLPTGPEPSLTKFLFILDLYRRQMLCSFVSACPLLFCSLLCTLGAQRCPRSALCIVQTRLMLRLKNLLPPSPHRGAPPPRRAQSCGYHSEALPVNKINQGKHLGKKKNPNKTKTTRTSWSLHLQCLQQRERHRSDESFQATI